MTIMKFIAALICVGALLMGPIGCGGPRLVHDEWEPGKPKRHGTVIDHLQEGLWEYWYANGAKESAGSWTNDKQDGEWTWWYPDGRIKQTGSYTGSQGSGIDLSNRSSSPRTGVWRYWHANGQLQSMGAYNDDRQDGPWSYFAENGAPFASGLFVKGQKDGAWTWWHANGQRKEAGTFSQGIKVGLWNTWDDKGALQENVTYTVDGKVVSNAPVAAISIISPPVAEAPSLLEKEAAVPPVVAVKINTASEQPAVNKDTIMQKPASEEIEMAAKDANVLSPNASIPSLWTTEQEANAAALVKAYTTGALHRLRGYKNERFTDTKDRQRKDLIGTPLAQTRFINADGGVLDIDALRKKGPVLLVFLRGFSGQVCLYCAAQTTAISNSIERFRKAGIHVVVVYPGPVDAIPTFMAAVRSLANEPPLMPVVLDVSLIAVRKLGIEGNLAKPTSLFIDTQGKIRYAYEGKTIADRPPVEELLHFGSAIAQGAR